MLAGIYCVMALRSSSVWLRAEGPRDAKSCRGTRVATVVHAAYCYTRSCGVVGPSTRPIAIGAMCAIDRL